MFILEFLESDSSLLARTASVMRDWGVILYRGDAETSVIKSGDRSLTSRARTLDAHLYFANAHPLRLGSRTFRGTSGRERGGLSGTLEPYRPGRIPTKRLAAHIGERDDRVVEAGVHMHDCLDDVSSYLLLAHNELISSLRRFLLPCRAGTLRSNGGVHFKPRFHDSGSTLHTLLTSNGLGTALTCASIALGALPTRRKATTMTVASVGADIPEPLDVLTNLPLQGTFDDVTLVDDRSDLTDIRLSELRGLLLWINPCLGKDFISELGANAMDISKGISHLLTFWDVDTCNTWHLIRSFRGR